VGAAVIDEQGRRTEITGIVHSAALGTFERRVEPAIYFPMSQDTLPRMTLMVRVQKASEAALAELGRRIAAVPGQGPRPVTVKTLETQLSQTGLAPLHIATAILSASAAIALGLSVFGLFGALSDAARQRRREFAVRIALGAQRRHVIYQVLRDGGRLAFTGILAGATGSVVVWRLVGGIAPQGHASLDWRAWLAAPTALMIAVVIASVLPARRALLVNPVTILRDDRAG
jgi:predicted lysophospholipase L1 biosynthesis ABC-type transport system permease subunit